MLSMDDTEKGPIALHVIVVGFHHKKGMIVEYAYPPLPNDELPDKWKHLPSLCLPDGAHNHEADTIYFHLPNLDDPQQTVFGVSCYRQIDAEKVHNKTADITRNTVQKSVCVLTTLPIYGYVQERLRVTTKVYFKEADFSDVRDLEGLYHDLNTTNWKDRLMHGICVSDAVRIFGRNILVLFKLLLLEKKVLFFHSPVGPLVKTITSLLTLLPSNLPDGLTEAAASNNEAEIPTETDPIVEEIGSECLSADTPTLLDTTDKIETQQSKEKSIEIGKIINVATEEILATISDDLDDTSSTSSLTSVTSRGSIMSPSDLNLGQLEETPQSAANMSTKISNLKGKLSGAFSYWTTTKDKSVADKPSATATPNPSPSDPGDHIPLSPTSGAPLLTDQPPIEPENQYHVHVEKYASLDPASCGLPLNIFTKGNVVHPYLSLQYLDVLKEARTRAFVVGASNTLFIHKKNLYDVLVHLEEGKIEIFDADLRKQLSLSTEDLRFAENIIRQVEAVNASMPSGDSPSFPVSQPDVFLDGVGWMGGEEWLRHQFKVYLLSMMRSVSGEPSRATDMYNPCFVSAWKDTHNYRMWSVGQPYPELDCLAPGHPNAGNLSMSDMRIRLSHTIQGLDKNKRLNQTLASTGTAVVKTKEAVGGALTSAKGAISNFWSSFTTNEKGIEQATEAIYELPKLVESPTSSTPIEKDSKEQTILQLAD